jgi:uncharacterized membrane protein YjjP (DUF1212 family)
MQGSPLPIEVRFIRLLARRLHQYGSPAHRLESAVSLAASRLGLECEVFSTPTSIFLTFADEGQEHYPTQLIRLRPGSPDVGKLCRVDAVAEAVGSGEIELSDGADQLLALEKAPPEVGIALQLAAWAAVGFSVVQLFGGPWRDLMVGALLGGVTGLLTIRLGQRWQETGSFEPFAAFVITALAYLMSEALGGVTVANVVVAALIILMPGMDLTVAITELSTGHLASGTARFAGAVVVLLKLALGVVLATQVMNGLGFSHELPEAILSQPWDWFTWVAVVIAGFAFCVLFNALKQDWWAVIVAALVAYATSHYGTQWLGTEAGIFLAALAVAGVSNLYGRIFNQPSAVMRLPGIILLVPGSLGYRALNLLFSHNLDDGLEAAVSVAIVLASLVGGLLLGNTLMPPRRSL